jgi:spermidine synthase
MLFTLDQSSITDHSCKMKPNIKLAEAKTPNGQIIALYEHDGSFCIRMNSQEIMHSLSNASELQLGKVGAQLREDLSDPRILIGGLGLGFTLKGVLENTANTAKIEVVELIPEIIEWNKTFLKDLNGKLINDNRVELLIKDAFEVIKRSKNESYDAIILDTDNGPTALVQKENHRFYSRNGLKMIHQRIKRGGKLAIWSANNDPNFVDSLKQSNFEVETIPAKSNENAKRFNHVIFLAHKI